MFLLIALAVYGWQVSRIVRDGGKVFVDELALPELLMSFVFAGFFTMMAAAAVQRHGHEETKVNIDAVLPNSILFIIFDLEVAFLFPWAISLKSTGMFGFWSMVGFLAVLTVGFIYEWKKGALEWE